MFVIEAWHWLVFGVILIISEMLLVTFATLWFGIAAFIVSALIWLVPLPFTTQVLLWLALSIIMVVLWFKFIQPLLADRTKAGLGSSTIIGEVGMITVKPQPEQVGTVRFSVPVVGSTEWMCRTRNENIEVGDRVVVIDIAGNELIVQSMPAKVPRAPTS